MKMMLGRGATLATAAGISAEETATSAMDLNRLMGTG